MEGPNIENKQPVELIDISKKLFEFSKQIPELENVNDEDLRRLGEHFNLEPSLEIFVRKIGMIYQGQKEKEENQ